MFRSLMAAATLAALLAGAPAGAQEGCDGRPEPVRLQVKVEGLRSPEGLVAITVYGDDPKRFLAKRGSLYVIRVTARAPVTVACVPLPAPGVYALAVYHDLNANRKIDRTAIGLPAEPVGLSNDPPTLLGLPSFRSVRFTAVHGGSITIPLKSRRRRGD